MFFCCIEKMKNHIVRAYVQKLFHGFELHKMYILENKNEFFKEIPLQISNDNLPTIGKIFIPRKDPVNIYKVLHFRILTESPKRRK